MVSLLAIELRTSLSREVEVYMAVSKIPGEKNLKGLLAAASGETRRHLSGGQKEVLKRYETIK